LIFFVLNPRYSIVNHLPHSGHNRRTAAGFTGWNDQFTCSEVYIDHGIQTLAQVAFHEAMHNKTHYGDRALHSRDGLAQPATPGASPSDNNKQLMAQFLTNQRPQWLAGFNY